MLGMQTHHFYKSVAPIKTQDLLLLYHLCSNLLRYFRYSTHELALKLNVTPPKLYPIRYLTMMRQHIPTVKDNFYSGQRRTYQQQQNVFTKTSTMLHTKNCARHYFALTGLQRVYKKQKTKKPRLARIARPPDPPAYFPSEIQQSLRKFPLKVQRFLPLPLQPLQQLPSPPTHPHA